VSRVHLDFLWRRTWMMQIFSVHAAQTSRQNASNGPLDHGMSSADNHSNPPPAKHADRFVPKSEMQSTSRYRRASRTRTRMSWTTAPVVADMWQPGSVHQHRLQNHLPRGSKLRGSQLRGSTFRGKRRQHGSTCPLGTARLSARPQESSNNMWHRTTNGTLTG
jgi:hypothetical protein